MRNWSSIKGRADIERTKSGVCVRSQFFIINAIAGTASHRVLIVASKKRVGKKAVLRNRAKRRIRAAFDLLEFSQPLDISIILNQAILTAEFDVLVKELQRKYAACQNLVYGDLPTA